jgi:hypothetical protein
VATRHNRRWFRSLPSDEEGWWQMFLRRQAAERQADMLVSWAEMPRSPGHVFYEELQAVPIAARFDAFVGRNARRNMRRVAAARRCRQASTSACR